MGGWGWVVGGEMAGDLAAVGHTFMHKVNGKETKGARTNVRPRIGPFARFRASHKPRVHVSFTGQGPRPGFPQITPRFSTSRVRSRNKARGPCAFSPMGELFLAGRTSGCKLRKQVVKEPQVCCSSQSTTHMMHPPLVQISFIHTHIASEP